VPEPNLTPVPDISEADAHLLELSCGGDLAITRVAHGRYRLTLDCEGVHLSVPLTLRDVYGVRAVSGDVVMRHLDTLEETP
jgi:hypothetical protein